MRARPSTLVLLSGGVDSSVALANAVHEETAELAVSYWYKQRHSRELTSAAAIARHFGVEHEIVDLSSYANMINGSSSLVSDRPSHRHELTGPETIVPGRNGVFLAVAAGIALARGIGEVVIAAQAGDARTYPDCRPAFIAAAAEMVRLATEGRVNVVAPFGTSPRREVVQLGDQLRVPFDLTWSCYAGGTWHCGDCDACMARKFAFDEAGVDDPAEFGAPACT